MSDTPSDLRARLLSRYGAELEAEGLDEAARAELLLALWQIMSAFVEMGFSLRPGSTFGPECDIGMDDVLRYLHLEETAHETVAPDSHHENKEQHS